MKKFSNTTKKRVPQRRLAHYLLTYVEADSDFYSYPIHQEDIDRMPDRDRIRDELTNRGDPAQAKNFEEYWVNSVGEDALREVCQELLREDVAGRKQCAY